MDFTRQLANLQRNAAAASSSSSSSGRDGGGRGGGGRGRGGGSYYDGRGGGRWGGGGGRSDPRDYGRKRRGGGGFPRDNRRRGGRGGGDRHPRQRRRIDDDEELRVALETLPRYLPTAVAPLADGEEPSRRQRQQRRHIALLFLTIDDLPYEHLWREWASSSPPGVADDDRSPSLPLVSVLCHAKYPDRVKSPWLKRRLLLERPSRDAPVVYERDGSISKSKTKLRYHTRRPEWGSVEITRGMIDLLDEAMRIGTEEEREEDERRSRERYLATEAPGGIRSDADGEGKEEGEAVPSADRFVFASETCVPVTTLAEAELALYGPPLTEPPAPMPEEPTSEQPSTAEDGTGGDDERGVKAAPSAAAEVEATPAAGGAVTSPQPPPPSSSSPYDKSWVNASSTPNNGYARQQQWDKVHRSLPQSFVRKADQWIVLVRDHARAVLEIDDALPTTGGGGGGLWRCFRNVRASDEVYFPTALALLGIVDAVGPSSTSQSGFASDVRQPANGANAKDIGPEVIKRRVTYADWSEGSKNPASFTSGLKDLKTVAKLAREEGCLFARKFREPTVMEWEAERSRRRRYDDGKKKTKEDEERDRSAISVEEWRDVVHGLAAAPDAK